ncbi:hypothetical protein [Streptomyces ziwulingensis]|uniref:Membrane-bound hydrophilic protein n=1 Tax=Streptomyces ziwulingensis TaxID=1045501 RepID=A0ABP9B9C8_9ACTN
MPADEVTHRADAEAFRVRTGPRHAAPKKPLLTRFHVPAGKAIALAAMPTAVLMGMGFTPTLAVADGSDPASSSKSLTADEYKACVEALARDKDGASASATPSPSASASASGGAEPSPSASATSTGPSTGTGTDPETGTGSGTDKGAASSSDSGSDDKAASEPSGSASAAASPGKEPAAQTSPSPSATEGGGLLQGIGDALEDLLTGGKKDEESTAPAATPSPSASASATASPSKGATGDGDDTAPAQGGESTGSGEQTGETAEDPGPGAGGTAEDPLDPTGDTTASPSSTPTPTASESATTDPVDCPIATDEEGGVDNTLPVPDDPWYLDASSLTLKGASYKGIVKVRTAGGTTKKVLKYVISNGTDIGDLHQTVKDDLTGKTYHVQAAKGSTSTITDGDTVMYTESISGNLLGLVPITFDVENPPPLDIPLIYFTKAKVVQAGQFGGTLTIPGLHQYMTD